MNKLHNVPLANWIVSRIEFDSLNRASSKRKP